MNPQSLQPYLESLPIWFSLHTLHCRVLSLHRCQTTVVEMKPATYDLIKMILGHPFDNAGSIKNEIDFTIIFATW